MKSNNILSKNHFSQDDLDAICRHTQSLIAQNPYPAYLTYDWNYTQELIAAAHDLIEAESLDDSTRAEADVLIYFYVIGYNICQDDPLKKSASNAHSFLINRGFDPVLADRIRDSILHLEDFTRTYSLPVAVAQDVLTAFYGRKKLIKKVKKRFDDYNLANKGQLDEVKWFEDLIGRMITHRYNTNRSKSKRSGRKKKNIGKLRKYIYELKQDAALPYNKRAMTMFKTASRNQIDLVNIADKKAGIMITVNAILITILIPLFGSYIIDISRFIVPAIILLITCGISIILATLATKPLSKKAPTTKDFASGNRSLFYFENFIHLKKDEYKSAVQDLIVRDAPFENAVVTDLYDLGRILGVKYRKLTWCYWVFAIGIGLTILTFLGCLLFFEGYNFN